MKQDTIPAEVKKAAENIFADIVYVGNYKGSDVFGEKKSDEYPPSPTGLPTYILWNGVEAKVVSGVESFQIIEELFDE